MPVGVPILISVTQLDADFYGSIKQPGGAERLGPDEDALDFADAVFARGLPGVREPIFLGGHAEAKAAATRDNVRGEILAVAEEANAAAEPYTVFVYYAGHGARFSEGALAAAPVDAICLEDGFLFDVELVALWKHFPASSRLVFVPDCCHAADIGTGSWITRILRGVRRLLGGARARSLAEKELQKALESNPGARSWYTQAIAEGGDDPGSIACSLLVLAASGEDEILLTPDGRSPFSRALRAKLILNPDLPSYDALAAAVIAQIHSGSLAPALLTAGRTDDDFVLATPPFTV